MRNTLKHKLARHELMIGSLITLPTPELVDIYCQARNADIPVGIFGASAKAVKPFIKLGCSLIAVGTDTLMFAETVRATLELARA